MALEQKLYRIPMLYRIPVQQVPMVVPHNTSIFCTFCFNKQLCPSSDSPQADKISLQVCANLFFFFFFLLWGFLICVETHSLSAYMQTGHVRYLIFYKYQPMVQKTANECFAPLHFSLPFKEVNYMSLSKSLWK